ncbi:MAG: response regulator transcription factor [Lachnoclostridium sp.]|jgi:DNA-binding response OmpR family regulator|nr:response regulator transcription factor [Lachnoclostridium sp.]
MASAKKILIVDDNVTVTEMISSHLTKEFFECKIAKDGEEALELFESYQPDLILLDLILPIMDGYAICREIRKTSSIPIIMLSAKGETFDKVLGLELGADDYIVKPFDSKELTARIKAVLRRYRYDSATDHQIGENENAGEYVSYTDLIISLSNYTVHCMGEPIEMPPKELELFYFLAKHPNQVFTREQLLDQIWGYEYIVDTRTVDVHIKRLREKISEHPEWSLSTVWGIGYKFETKRKK